MTTLPLRVSLCFAAAALIGFQCGCESGEKKQEQERITQVNTPLEIDPSDPIVIGPWWSDGRHLMNLRSDGGYSIYDNNNRYARPIDRGRWGRQNYATLWLEPYTGLTPQRIRVQVVKDDARFGLSVPKYQTMFALASPPAVMEDQLVGGWQGEFGVLTLSGDLTYLFAPANGVKMPDGTPVIGHNGKWKLANNRVTLNPSSPSVSTQSLNVKPAATSDANSPPTMDGLGMTLMKVEQTGS